MENIYESMNRAANEGKILNITYRDSKGNISTRDTEPYEIKGDSYYAFCRDKSGIRAFVIDNIVSAIVTDSNYSPRWPVAKGTFTR